MESEGQKVRCGEPGGWGGLVTPIPFPKGPGDRDGHHRRAAPEAARGCPVTARHQQPYGCHVL